METITWQVPETVLVRQIDGEALVVNLENASVYYCEAAAEVFFEFFRQPRTFSEYARSVGWRPETLDSESWKTWVDFLRTQQLIRPSENTQSMAPIPAKAASIPRFLRYAPETTTLRFASLADNTSKPPPPP